MPYTPAEDHARPAITKDNIGPNTGGVTWPEYLHLIFAHRSSKRIHSTMLEMEGAPPILPLTEHEAPDVPCHDCLRTRMKQQRKPSMSRHKNATGPGQILCFGMHNLPVQGPNVEKYYTLFVDVVSRYQWIFFHSTKKADIILAILEDMITNLRQKPDSLNLHGLISGNAGEYLSGKVQVWCREHHISLTQTCPHYHYQAGLAEAPGYHLTDTARALMMQAELPQGLYLRWWTFRIT